jgi:hypothetical protein
MLSSSRFTRLIASIGLIGVLLFLIFGSSIKKHVEEKVFDSTYQFFLITIVGGGVSLVYEAYRRERESRERQREIQRNLRSNLISSYNSAKQIRRLLRAKAVRIDLDTRREIVLGEEYSKQLDKLIEAQLSFELAVQVVKSEPELFVDSGSGDTAPDLAAKLESVEDYLNEIINEYEKSYKTFTGDPAIKDFSELPKLREFIGPFSEANELKERVVAPFYKALEIISKVIQIQ